MPNNEEFELYKKLLEEHKPGSCEACGGFLTLEKVNLEDYHDDKLYMMKNVPAFVCGECGEVWVPEPIMLEFEKMIIAAKKHSKNKKGLKKKKKKARKSAKGGSASGGKKPAKRRS